MHLLNNVIVGLILLTGAIVSARLKKLTLPAAATGAILGWLVFAGGGYTGLGMLAAFFILGTLATSFKQKQKSTATSSVTRTTGQVLANGGIAALCGAAMLLFPTHHALFGLAMAASLASATADTLSSELGILYGSRHYNMLTLKPDIRGKDGVISVEGTLIGVAGSVVIAILYAIGHRWDGMIGVIVLSGTAGNLADSILGATLERKGLIGNDMVNFLNTLVAALLADVLSTI